MTVTAKFSVTKVSELGDGNGKRLEITKESARDLAGITHFESTGVPLREITLSAVFDNGIAAENASFAKNTPSGSITFLLNNPALAEEFKPGAAYYVEFHPFDR